MLAALALALLAAAAPLQEEPARGVIRGRVQSEPTGLPVALAVLEADDGTHSVLGMADSAGAYSLRVDAGMQTLRVRHLDHVPTQMEVLVPAGGTVDLDVVLQHRPIVLAPLNVRPSWDPRADSIAVSRPEFNLLVDRRVTEDGALSDALPPGYVPDPSDVSGGVGEALYVRGSAANTQLVLLDGAPVYAPFHMGGLIETFEPEVVGSARLYLGGAPARYDGGLSYVMDLTTRSGNGRHSAGGTVDMISTTGHVEGPLPGGVHYLASGRLVHGGGISGFEDQPFPYDFRDGLLKLDIPLPEGGISLTGFTNQEGMRLDTLGGGEGAARWGNRAGSIRYRGRFEGADVEMTLAGGRFDASLPMRDDGRLFILASRSDRVRAGIDFSRPNGPARVFYGGSFERTWLQHLATRPETFQTLVYTEVAGSAAGMYVDAEWQPNARMVVRGGVRGDAFSVGGRAVLAPRASITWLPTDRAALTLAAGRYHQYIRTPRPLPPGTPLRNFADTLRLATLLAVGGATHLSVGMDQELMPDVRLGLEGYYKRFDGLPNPRAPLNSSTFTAHNSGVDVWVRRTGGRVTGWMGYSLGWVWSGEDEQGLSESFIGRHTLSAGARGTVFRRTVMGVRLAYGSGLPHTQVTNENSPLPGGGSIPTEENGTVDLDTDAPLRGPSAYLRVDAELSRTWTPRFAGRRTQVTPYLRVINALESRDGLFYRYFDEGPNATQGGGDDENLTRLSSVATMPLVPVFGVTWKF
jgi:hypothetical protein